MDKLISQQAAIDALCKSECGWNNAECRHKDDTDFCVTCDNVKIIKSLPSVQPDTTTHDSITADPGKNDGDTTSGDCISRTQAIDVLHGYFDGMLETDTVCPADIYGLFECMPSVQPERKKAKWIDGQCSNCGCDTPAYIIDWKWQKDMDANFCPNCGADMRGDKHETD